MWKTIVSNKKIGKLSTTSYIDLQQPSANASIINKPSNNGPEKATQII